ncbi:predicted protein [Uncinocarpus reesii 1704]|uniref:Uncharacterized protein n=1 Tax=Uncinocarpus reesii (strain UAMH 1704) TaxID=336963 RepID=C4JTJ0_UNCRE|nr:uncharacterized protein UREG_05779 [Uncinocarpus reesii 1704]EEP80937.1 predicted protein [Uncinocarpus reesii 1704]
MPFDSSTSFSPADILPSTLAHLISRYPDTARAVYRTKLESKAKNSKDDIERQLKSFLELDCWRYQVLPAALQDRADTTATRPTKRTKRAPDASAGADGLHLNKDELVQLMEWKLKHGSFRPALMNLIRSNPDSQIHTATSNAFSSLPTALKPQDGDGDDALYPSASLEILTKSLRGVGPATASLILSASTASSSTNQVPFFSDEMYWWLCSHRYPPSSASSPKQSKPPPKLKYTVKEYRELWDAARELIARMNTLDEKHSFSMQEIEQAAFVIGHFEQSGHDSLGSEVVLPPVPAAKGDEENTKQRSTSKKRRR